MKRAVLLLFCSLLAACSVVSPEARVRQKLVAAGVHPAMADCMAGKLVRKLDADELSRLGQVAKRPARRLGEARIDDLADRLRALDDPHIVSVVTRVSLGCAIAG